MLNVLRGHRLLIGTAEVMADAVRYLAVVLNCAHAAGPVREAHLLMGPTSRMMGRQHRPHEPLVCRRAR
jgi:hypothetical protein